MKPNADGPWVVQKYGGTSVGKFLPSITENIVPQFLELGKRVALVCSARSGKTKSTGTTSLLLKAAKEAQQSKNKTKASRSHLRLDLLSLSYGESTPGTPRDTEGGSSAADGVDYPEFMKTIDLIKSGHDEAARESIKNPEILKQLLTDINEVCEDLKHFIMATQVIEEVSPKSMDIIIGTGEKLACLLVTAALNDQGIEAEIVSLDDVVQDGQEESDGSEFVPPEKFLGQAFYTRVAENMARRIKAVGNKVPVITGFFGRVPGSLLEQIGRGYSDLCAALCASALPAEELQIWKEVDGIFTADPRRVPTARLLTSITPEEAAELTYYGSEVIHPFTMEQAVRAQVPVRILNVQNPTGDGTVIITSVAATPEPQSLANSTDDITKLTLARMPTAVTIKEDVFVLSLLSNRKTMSHGFLARTFSILDRYGIVVDLISTSEVHVSMAVNGNVRPDVLDSTIKELTLLGEVHVRKNMAILSLVGKDMRHLMGIAGKMFSTLAEARINIHMISQGASEINISCVIEAGDGVKALNVVHHRLLSKSSLD